MTAIIEVEEINAEDTGGVLSVCMGFKSELSAFDVLFVMCGRELDERSRIGGLYFERFDQLYSCYDAAEFIWIGESWFDYDFTLESTTELKLPKSTRFDCRLVLAGFQQAVGILEQMAQLEWGKVIHARGR